MFERFRSTFGQHRILGGAAVLAVTQAGASVAGLIRDRLLAQTFPGLATVDVYIAAFRPSDFLFQITIMSAFSVALVPLLARYHASGEKEKMFDLLAGATSVAAIVFGLLALVFAIIFPWVAPLLTHFTGESLQLYIHFGRIALLTNFLFVFGNAYGQYLITVQRYWVYGITPILYTIGTILGTLFLTPVVGEYGPIYGTLLGAVAYTIVRFLGILLAGYRPRFVLWHPDIAEMGWLMIPRVLALGALQFSLLVFDALASGLSSGSVTINAYARNFQSVAVGIVGIALAQSVFSLLSQTASRNEHDRFRMYIKKGTWMMLALTIPSAIALVLLARTAAWLVHLNGAETFPLFSLCLLLYALSIPFESMGHLLLRAFYALKDTFTPALISVANGVVAIAVAWILVGRLGVLSLPIGFTAGQVVQVIGLGILLRRKRL
ncbi:MAG: lipid II flippase MurJ [Candidatus Peregrinibacteria bacterium]